MSGLGASGNSNKISMEVRRERILEETNGTEESLEVVWKECNGNFLEFMKVSYEKIPSKWVKEPSPNICYPARFLVMGLVHQPCHKSFDLSFVVPPRYTMLMKVKILWKWKTNDWSNSRSTL